MIAEHRRARRNYHDQTQRYHCVDVIHSIVGRRYHRLRLLYGVRLITIINIGVSDPVQKTTAAGLLNGSADNYT